MKRLIILAAAGMAFASPAWAKYYKPCPDTGNRTYYTVTGLGTVDSPYVAHENVVRVCDEGKGIAWTGDFDNEHLTPVLVDEDNNPDTPKTQLIVDGKPIVTSDSTSSGNHQHDDAQVHGINGVAVGDNSLVGKWIPPYDHDNNPDTPDKPGYFQQVDNGTAVGAGSKVEHNGSTALGAGASSTRENQVVLGTEKTSVTAPGIRSGTQYQSGPTELVTTDLNGNLGTDGGSTFSTINAHSALLSSHTAQLEEHSKGLAIAMAMPDAWLSDKKRFGIFGSVGGFEGETALGFAAIGRIDETWSLNAKLGADTDFDHVGWQVGFGAQW